MSFTYEDETGQEFNRETQNDLYISAGLNLTMFNNKLQILPSAVYHKLQSTELQGFGTNDLQLGASFVLFEKVWVSGAYHTGMNSLGMRIYNSTDVRVGVNLKNGLRISGRLEFPTSLLMNSASTNGGIMLGYRVSNGDENPYLGRRHFF